MAAAPGPIHTYFLGEQDYRQTWTRMREKTESRGPETPDELWVLSHPAVYTLGQAGRHEHILRLDDTPVIETDRGGQVTWHGPGQIIAYPLLDLRRWNLGIRRLVHTLEDAVLALLLDHRIDGERRPDAPGVYVDGAKIAALGLRVRRGCSYHGVALNVENDLAPFQRINPCGYAGLRTTRLRDLGVRAAVEDLEQRFAHHIRAAIAASYSD